jgi:hypothetical protein
MRIRFSTAHLLLVVIVVAWTLQVFQHANGSLFVGFMALNVGAIWICAGTILGAEVRKSVRQALTPKAPSRGHGVRFRDRTIELVAWAAGLATTLSIWMLLIMTLICFGSLHKYTRFELPNSMGTAFRADLILLDTPAAALYDTRAKDLWNCKLVLTRNVATQRVLRIPFDWAASSMRISSGIALGPRRCVISPRTSR